jgi:hypothetical protein
VKPEGNVDADLFIYMDDFRPTGPDEEACWQVNRKAGSTCNNLGIQDAPMTQRGASRTPGPWAGSIAYNDNPEEGIRVLISQKKGDNVNRMLNSLMAKLEDSLWVDPQGFR